MNSATWVKFLAGVLLFAAWLVLVLMRIVPPGPLVDAIGYALVGLGIYHASANGSSTSPLLASLLARLTQTGDPAQASAAAPGRYLGTQIITTSTSPAPTSAPAPAAAPAPATVAPAVAAGTLQ